MEPRQFSKEQRVATSLVSDVDHVGKQADHIKPFSTGGNTNVENCQLLSPEANRKKSDHHKEPRKWQKSFIRQWQQRQDNVPFMLVAIPGGGKTFASLMIAKAWMQAASDRRVIVVVPSDNLREQWKTEASKFGIELQTKEFGTNFKDGFQGAATSYQLVAKQPLVFRKLCSVAPTMVILDEVHHCGDEASFGIGIKQAFELSKEKLLMSGTPWKTDGKAIPFVRYDGSGFVVSDYSYDYPLALVEEVVRYLVFSYAKGQIKYDDDGSIEHVNQGITDEEASQRLRKLLDPSGSYISDQIRDAHRKLLEIRKTIPDAAAMAACIDQFHAVQVAATIESVTGCKPSVIVSDGELANDSVGKFRKSSTEWLVSVRQVSEGTDIQRLQVLCYFTNTTSEMFFRQLIGRVSRVRGLEDFEAYIYLPADPRLIRCAQNIENAQVQALIDAAEVDSRYTTEMKQSELLPVESFSTVHDGVELVLIGNHEYTTRMAAIIERAAESAGISMERAAKVIASVEAEVVETKLEAQTEPKEDAMDELRRKCNKVAFRLSKQIDVKPAAVHRRFKRQREMTEAELRAKLTTLVQMSKDAT